MGEESKILFPYGRQVRAFVREAKALCIPSTSLWPNTHRDNAFSVQELNCLYIPMPYLFNVLGILLCVFSLNIFIKVHQTSACDFRENSQITFWANQLKNWIQHKTEKLDDLVVISHTPEYSAVAYGVGDILCPTCLTAQIPFCSNLWSQRAWVGNQWPGCGLPQAPNPLNLLHKPSALLCDRLGKDCEDSYLCISSSSI